MDIESDCDINGKLNIISKSFLFIYRIRDLDRLDKIFQRNYHSETDRVFEFSINMLKIKISLRRHKKIMSISIFFCIYTQLFTYIII